MHCITVRKRRGSRMEQKWFCACNNVISLFCVCQRIYTFWRSQFIFILYRKTISSSRTFFFFRFEGDSAAAYLNRLYCYWNQITFARIRNSITYIKWVVFANTSCATQFNIITCYLLVWRLYRKLNNIWIVYLELICSLARFNHIEMIESQSVFVTREKDLIIQ